ncbi:MAG: hypothetical protein GY765_35925, partial [bacterium]|nr:hypothetical protein [bacterium]
RNLAEFNISNRQQYKKTWLRREHSRERTVYYSYNLPKKTRIVYYVKALYPGEFTWLPTAVTAMYEPEIYGRNAAEKIVVSR